MAADNFYVVSFFSVVFSPKPSRTQLYFLPFPRSLQLLEDPVIRVETVRFHQILRWNFMSLFISLL